MFILITKTGPTTGSMSGQASTTDSIGQASTTGSVGQVTTTQSPTEEGKKSDKQ